MSSSTKVADVPVRWGVLDALAVLFGAQLSSLVWAGAVIAVAYGGVVPDPLSVTDLVVLNVGLWFGYGLGPIIVARAKGQGAKRDYGAWLRPIDVPFGLALGVVLQLVVLEALYWPILRVVDGDPGESARKLVDSANGVGGWLLLVLSVVVIAPAVEELFFRGLFLRALQARFGSGPAIVISALVFGIVHLQLLPLPGLILFGAAAAGLTVWSGRLGPAWALHIGFNSATLVVLGLDATW